MHPESDLISPRAPPPVLYGRRVAPVFVRDKIPHVQQTKKGRGARSAPPQQLSPRPIGSDNSDSNKNNGVSRDSPRTRTDRTEAFNESKG